MEPSWFVSRLRESVARHGDAASSTLDILGSLPIEAVRRNIAAGLRFAADRGREPWRHQTECMAAIERQLLDESRQPNAIVVMPTGGGKTEIFIRTTEASGLDAGGLRLAVPTIVLEPTRQLVDQTVSAFQSRFPALHVAGLDSGRAPPGSVTVMSYDLFADMVQDGRIRPGDVGAITMDEAHRGLSDIRQDLIKRFIGSAVVTAYSATPAFDAIKNVHALLGKENEVADITDERLRHDGVISPVANYVLRVRLAGQLPPEVRLRRAAIREATARAVTRFVATHREEASGMALRDKLYFAYTNGVARAADVARMLSESGLRADSVSGSDRSSVINDKLAALASGGLRVLVNDQVLVEGTDVAQARGVLAVDPTTSLVKHLQRCGRARRIDPTMDRFDPRQTSSVVDVVVEINGVPLQDQRIYAEAIGDLSIAQVFSSRPQSIDAMVQAALASGRIEGAEAEDEMDTAIETAASRAGGVAPSRNANGMAKASSSRPVPPAATFEISEDLQDVHFLLRRRERDRPEEYLTRALAAAALHVTPKNPALAEAFEGLREALADCREPTVGGMPVRAELYGGGTATVPCIHADDLGVLRRHVGLPDSEEEVQPGWLNKVQVAGNLRIKVSEPAMTEAWQAAATGEMALPKADDGGPGMRPMRRNGHWHNYIHPNALPSFEERLGKKAKFRFPAKEERHISFDELCKSLGTIRHNQSAARAWQEICDVYAKQGAVMDGRRRVDFDVVRYPHGMMGPCISRAEIPWFSEKSGLPMLSDKTDEWIGLTETAAALRVAPGQRHPLGRFWAEIRRTAAGGEATAAGRTWRAELMHPPKGSPTLCIHRSHFPDLQAMFARSDERLKTPGWLKLSEVAVRVGISATTEDAPLSRAWRELRETLAATGQAMFGGKPYVFAERHNNAQTVFCLHHSQIDALRESLGVQSPAGPKTDEWLVKGELATLLGGVVNTPGFVDAWGRIEEAGKSGTLRDGNRPVRMELRKTDRLAYWCLHADEVPWFSRNFRMPVPVPRTAAHLQIREIQKQGWALRNYDSLKDILDGLARQVEDGMAPTLPNGVRVRYEFTKDIKRCYCLHSDDLDRLRDYIFELEGRNLVRPKTEEWLSRTELAEALGTAELNPSFAGTWKDIVAKAEAGTLRDGSRPIRIEMRKTTQTYWCLHRDEVAWFSVLSRIPVPVSRAEHHVLASYLMRASVPRARREAIAELTRGLIDLVERGEPPILPDGRPIRFEFTKDIKRAYCFHRDDLGMLNEVVLSGSVSYDGDEASSEEALQPWSP